MIITSVNNEHIKEINKLKEKKYRDITGKFLIEGEHLILEANKHNLIEELIILEGNEAPINFHKVTYVNKEVMKKISSLDNYPNIIAVSRKKKDEEIGTRVLLLEDVQDPGNLGTIIRSAVAFNINTIILSTKTVDLYNSKVIRSTQGMLFHINIIVKEPEEIINTLKEKKYQILGTKVDGGKDIKNTNTKDKFVLIIGNEGKGMSDRLSTLCDEYLYIKMNNNVESLNAGVAASIILYELGSK